MISSILIICSLNDVLTLYQEVTHWSDVRARRLNQILAVYKQFLEHESEFTATWSVRKLRRWTTINRTLESAINNCQEGMDHVLTTLIKKKKKAITLFKVENFTIKQVQNYICVHCLSSNILTTISRNNKNWLKD